MAGSFARAILHGLRSAKSQTTEAVTTALRTQSGGTSRWVHWDRLAAEMTANIHLGLEAGECIGPVRVNRPERIGWRAVTVMAGISALLMGAWWLNPPRIAREVALHRTPVESSLVPGRDSK